MKTIILLLFLTQPNAVADTTQPVEKKTFLNRMIEDPTGIFYTPIQRKQYNFNRKHQLFFQVFGDTPAIGMGYSYRAWENSTKKVTVETGLGLGLNPFAGYNSIKRRNDPVSPYNFSHNVRAVFWRNGILSPYLSYSGIWWSGRFYKDKTYNYRPTGGIGLRVGNSDRFFIQLGFSAYFFKYTSIQVSQSEVNTYRNKAVMGIPSFSFHIPFGAKPTLK